MELSNSTKVNRKDKYHRYVILIATEESARILEVNLGAETESLWTKRPELRERAGRVWTKEHYQNHRRNRTDRFFKEKIEILKKLMGGGGYSHLIVAGSPKITSQLQKLLPKKLSTQLVDIIPASEKIKTESLVERTLTSFIQHEQGESFHAVERLKAELFGDGLAVVGADECIKALGNGQRSSRMLIPDFVRKNDIDLIVMGTLARSGIKGFLIGNTAEKIVSEIHCSVLAVKPDGFVSPITV